jgi:hypothetical protein
MKSFKKYIKDGVLGLALLFVGACAANQLTPTDYSNLSTFSAEIALCNTQADPVACKKAAKDAFDAARETQFDGGYAAPDGGTL